MFELHVGNTPCELTREDYRDLAEQTEGYAASIPLLPSSHVLKVLRFRYRDYCPRRSYATRPQSHVRHPLQGGPLRWWDGEMDALLPW